MQKKPKVSIIVPMHSKDLKHLETLTKQLKSFRHVDRTCEIILVLNGFDKVVHKNTVFDEIKKINIANIKYYVFEENLIIGLARNYGAAYSNGTFFIFMDADIEISRKSIHSIYRHIDKWDPTEGALMVNPMQNKKGGKWCSLDSGEDLRSYRTRITGTNSKILYGPFSVIKAEHFYRIGGWEYRTVSSEDRDLAEKLMRAGFTIKYCKTIKVLHNNPVSLRSIFKRKRFHASVNALTYARYPEHYNKSIRDWIQMLVYSIKTSRNMQGVIYSIAVAYYIMCFKHYEYKLYKENAHLIEVVPFFMY